MDSSRSNLCQEDVKELLNLLESSNSETVNSVKALIQENLNGTKDVWLLHGLIDYHIAVQSKHALEILVRVREPHDKNLFDKMAEYIKNENKRYRGLLLLSHIVHKQPSWLHKIAYHKVFQTLLTVLKTEKDSPSLLCALFITVCLLPMIPSKIGPHLNDIFEIFSRLASWSVKNSIGVPEVHVLHLQVGVYTLFHRLYGMYPCNFLGYLRSYYGRREYKEENLCIFTNVIKPMLHRVKLHPLLVTACKETELSDKRWRRMAPHDIIVECANISLDAIEGTSDDLQSKYTGFNGQMQPVSYENSSQHVSFSSQSSTTSTTVESIPAISENATTTIKQDVLWSPSLLLDTTSSQMLHNSLDSSALKRPFLNNLSPQGTAETESPHFFNYVDERTPSIKNTSDSDSIEKHFSNQVLTGNMDVVEALEAKEEELADKEVCELTSSPHVLDQDQKHLESRHDTPFCSTTQNLTDMPENSEEKLTDVNKDKNDDYQIDVLSQEQSEIKMEQVVQTINRLRYFSQCCTPPNIPKEKSEKTFVARSSSCPNITFVEIHSKYETCDSIVKDSKVSSDIASTVPVTTTSSYYKNSVYHSTFSNTTTKTETSYSHLIPVVVQPMTQEKSTGSTPCTTCLRCSSCSFTPAELLDRHVLLSKENYFGQLNSIPLTSTKKINWTHFGGKAPPDEIQMLQTQILLLHNQLMFERHRREIHVERNRRLLGKAKRSRMQDEYTHALRDQVTLLEKENIKFEKQLEEIHKLYRSVCEEKKNSEYTTDATIKKLVQEKNELHYTIKKLQGLLVSQKQEIEVIRDDKKLSQSQTLELEFENEVMKREIGSFSAKEKELLQLSKQNALLHELNQLYVDKLEFSRQPVVANSTIDLLNDVAFEEIKGLHQKLDTNTIEVDIGLARIAELEAEMSSSKSKLQEQTKVMENIQALHKDEIVARDDRLTCLKKIISRNESHILELYQVQEDLHNKIEVLTSQKKKQDFLPSSSTNSENVECVPLIKMSANNSFDMGSSEKERYSLDDFTISVN